MRRIVRGEMDIGERKARALILNEFGRHESIKRSSPEDQGRQSHGLEECSS
jgi:hypothetical protein